MLGIGFGQLLGGLGADHFGARPVFVALALWFAVTAWLMGRAAPAETYAAPPGAGAGGILMRFASVLEVRWARVVLASVFLEGLLFGALAFVPTHLHRAYGLPLTVAGAIVTLYGVGGLVFAALSRVLVRRLGEAGLAVGGAILLMLCFSTLAIVQHAIVAALACLLGGLGFYMLHNTLQVNATQMAPGQRGSSIALFAACLFLGQSAGVTLAGHSAERFGTAPVIAGAGLMLLVLGVLFGAARRRHRALV
jgi:predicted MFS family arabinose efflux permease